MPKTEQPIEQFELDYVCDVCNVGKMRIMSVSYIPPNYPHQCTNCQWQQTFDVKFPATAYRRIGEPKPHKG